MKNKKIKIAYLLTTFIFLFTYIGGLIGTIDSYAYDSSYISLASSNKNYSTKPKSTIKPSSGGFSTNSKNSSKKNNINSGSFSSNKNTTTIKPDSGSFSTKPNINNNSGSSSTTKPDSGSFSTTPKNNSNSSNDNNTDTNTNTNNREYGNTTSSRRPIFRGSYYGGYSPFRRVFFGYGMSSWIIKIVMFITIMVIIFIIIDYIRSKRD